MKQTSPPPGVGRKVKWRRSQLRAFALGALLCLFVTAGIVAYGYFTAQKKIQAQNKTVLTRGTITKRWRSGEGPAAHFWVAFRYPQLPADHPDQQMEIHRLVDWLLMNPGMQFVTSVVPDAPDSNGLTLARPRLLHKWLFTGGIASALAILATFWLYGSEWGRKRRDYRLVHRGQSTIAEITNVIETMVTRGDSARWSYEITYRFYAADGRKIEGSRREHRSERQFWEMGSVLSVFYDPRNPQRHALYIDLPAEVVSVS